MEAKRREVSEARDTNLEREDGLYLGEAIVKYGAVPDIQEEDRG